MKLNKGDSIAVFSPSSPATTTATKRYERAIHYLEEKRYHIVEGSLCGKQDYYRSGSILDRAEELNALIRNPDIKCIMAAIGGMNSNSLLPYLDYETLKENPKIIIGYSDVTALLLGIYAKTGLTTYYGPAMVASFGEFPPFVDQTFAYFESIVGAASFFPHQIIKPAYWTEEKIDWKTQDRNKVGSANQWVTLHEGCATGRLVGGNLNTIQGIWGSPYMPIINQGDILLIEDTMKDAATMERSFSFLKVNGVFERIGGLLLGKHELFDDRGTGRKPYDLLLEVMDEVNIPILAEFDCCHTHPMITMPIGCRIMLDATNQQITILNENM